MKNLDILNSATALVLENTESIPDDYALRAPYLLAAFCSSAIRVESKYREAYKLDTTKFVSQATLSMSDDFPMMDLFITAAIYYLGAMLVLDENEALSKKLLECCNDELDSITADAVATIAAEQAKIAAEEAKAEKAAEKAAQDAKEAAREAKADAIRAEEKAESAAERAAQEAREDALRAAKEAREDALRAEEKAEREAKEAAAKKEKEEAEAAAAALLPFKKERIVNVY